jgi:Glycosyltransferase family 87
MRSFVRQNAVACVAAVLGVLVVGWLGLSDWAWTDFDNEARPAFDALLTGHLAQFLQVAPAYGGSLLLRAPFALTTKLWGGGELSVFRAAAAPCLAASAILGIWLFARMRALGRARGARAVALFLCVANPLVLPTLEIGHPEELLGAVLCIAATVVATRNRPIWSGVLLGLAIANKEWALLAVGPVLIALPERRIRALLAGATVAAAVLAPFMLVGSAGFAGQVKGAATQTGAIFTPFDVWWFFGAHAHVIRDLSGHILPGHHSYNRVPPAWLGGRAHLLIVALALPLTLLCGWRRRLGAVRPAHEALLLLTLLLLLRFMLDPWDISYYALPFLLALVVWEALTFERPPVLALTAAFGAWFVFQRGVGGASSDAQSMIFLAVTVPVGIALAAALYAPGASARLSPSFRGRRAIAAPA